MELMIVLSRIAEAIAASINESTEKRQVREEFEHGEWRHEIPQRGEAPEHRRRIQEAEKLRERQRLDEVTISPRDIVDIVTDEIGGAFNCYPGHPCYDCHELAVFVSLTLPEHKGKHRGHLSCRKVLETLVQHTQGTCADGKTLEAVLVVDSWDSSAVSDWGSNLRKIRSEIHLEVYLISGGGLSRINL
jgi:hypothetical protein